MAITSYDLASTTLNNPGSPTTILHNTSKEMSHPRYSPDGSKLTYTLYNGDGGNPANEDYGYTNTEIHVCNANGTGDRVIVSATSGIVNAISSWIDNNNLTFLTNRDGVGRAYSINLGTLRITQLTVCCSAIADPQEVGSLFVCTVGTSIWLGYPTVLGGPLVSSLHQLTNPASGHADFDPRISPDGTKIAYMRFRGGSIWHVSTVIVASGLGTETDYFVGGLGASGVPDWSSDNSQLIYRFLAGDGTNPVIDSNQGIYTITIPGASRNQIALPRGPLFNHPSFFPNGNSAPTSFIYGARNFSPPLP